MLPFSFHGPTRITFGEHTARSVGDVVKQLGGKKTFIVTDANLIKAGVLTPVIYALKEDVPVDPLVFEEVPPDSDVNCVNKAARLAREAGCDSIVAVGGGSVIDTAKVVNICLTYGGEMMEYQGLNNLPTRLLPLVCIPTTAGTGSEVSLVAMIKDTAEHKKILFGSEFLAPNAAILDPNLILSLPPKLTAATGLDALTHCLEAFAAVSTASAISDALSLEAMRLLFENLHRATMHGDDLQARSATLVASTMAGLAFTNAGVGIVHAMAHATGAKFGTHHGITNAVYLPHGLEFNCTVVEDRYACAARFLGISKSENNAHAAKELIDAVRSLIERCRLPLRLRDLGLPEVSEDELEELANLAVTDPAIMFNPREATVEDIIDIYKRAF